MTGRARSSCREAAELARALSARLGLDPDLPNLLAPSGRPVLALRGAGGRRADAGLPMVVPTATATRAGLARSVTVVCGVRGAEDAPAVAIADALSDALGLILVLVHVRGPGPTVRSLAHLAGVEIDEYGEQDRGLRVLDEATRAAGLSARSGRARRIMGGAAGPALAVAVAIEQAALVVVGESDRSRRPRRRSATRHLSHFSPAPLVVCPADPAPAMRLREALALTRYPLVSGP